jgi:hypothetical protein
VASVLLVLGLAAGLAVHAARPLHEGKQTVRQAGMLAGAFAYDPQRPDRPPLLLSNDNLALYYATVDTPGAEGVLLAMRDWTIIGIAAQAAKANDRPVWVILVADEVSAVNPKLLGQLDEQAGPNGRFVFDRPGQERMVVYRWGDVPASESAPDPASAPTAAPEPATNVPSPAADPSPSSASSQP